MSGLRRAVTRESSATERSRTSSLAVAAARGDHRLLGREHRTWWRDSFRRRLLALADGVTAGFAVVALAAFSGGGMQAAFWSAMALPLWIVLAKLYGLYDRDHRAMRHLTADELPSIWAWTMTGTATTALLLAVTPVGSVGITTVLSAGIVAALGAPFPRGLVRMIWRRVTPPEHTLIVGEGPLADATRRKLELFRDIHVKPVAGPVSSLDELLDRSDVASRIDRIILASNALEEQQIAELVSFCRSAKIKLTIIPPARGVFGTAVQLRHVADLPVIEYNTWDVSRSTLLLKRVMDVLVSATALVLFLPFAFVIALAIRVESRGPIVFAQWRAGEGARPFRMYKFRSMVDDAEDLLEALVPFDKLAQPMFKLERDPRVTRVGRFLRRTSLDELPQLLNVLKGEMSLIGPRPEQIELVERYAPEQRFRLAIKPGLTGPMQVFGRGRLTFEERLAVEREYIENLSLGRDLRILALTLSAVARGDGAY